MYTVNPVGVLSFLFLPPDGLAAVLYDDALLSIAQASRVHSENRYQNLYRESTLVAPAHVLLPATPPHHRSQGYMYVCVCVRFVLSIFLYHTITLLEYL